MQTSKGTACHFVKSICPVMQAWNKWSNHGRCYRWNNGTGKPLPPTLFTIKELAV